MTAAALPAGIIDCRLLGGDTAFDCDCVVVGSGAGGAVVAAELAEAGWDVVVVEEGDYVPTAEFSTDASAMIRKLYRDGGASLALGTPPVLFQEGRTVGGSTVINGGMSWRTPDHILEGWGRDHGIEQISPRDLEPYFARVEKRISVAHQDPESIGTDNTLLKQGADRLGWRVVENLRNQVHCAGSNNCAFGCPTGAKQSTLLTYLPRALHFGARLCANLRVDEVTRHGKRATGVRGAAVHGVGQPGVAVTVRAKLVVVACGAMQTPALLARSGFRSWSGRLGHNLSLHPNVKVVARFDQPVRGWEGVHQAYQVREFLHEGLVFAAVNVPPSVVAMSSPFIGDALGDFMADYDKMVVAGMLLEDSATGRVRSAFGRAQAFYQLADADAHKLVRGVGLLSELLFAAGAREVWPPFEGAPVLASVDDARALARRTISKRKMEVLTVHLMGTAAMGQGRDRSVTDSWGRFHDSAGIFVADASVFPTPIGVNPMETIMALATRTAGHLIDNQRQVLA